MSDLNIAFEGYAYIGNVMHYILVISVLLYVLPKDSISELVGLFSTYPFNAEVKQGSREYQFLTYVFGPIRRSNPGLRLRGRKL